jgi:hypothetical protein
MSSLFYGAGDLRQYLKKRRANLQAEVDDCDPDYLLKVSEADFHDYLIAKYSVNPPKILTDRIYAVPQNLLCELTKGALDGQ